MQTDPEKLEELKYVVGRRIDYVYEKEHVIWVEGRSIVIGAESLDAALDSTGKALRAFAAAGASSSAAGDDAALVEVIDSCGDEELKQWIRDSIS